MGSCRRVCRGGARRRSRALARAPRPSRAAGLPPLLHRGARRRRGARGAHGRLRPRARKPGLRPGRDRRRAPHARERARAPRRDGCPRDRRPLPARLRGPRHRGAGRAGTPRSPHGAPQPPRLPRPALRGGRACPPLPRSDRARRLRPRPLQGDERQGGAPGGRPAPSGLRLRAPGEPFARRTSRVGQAATSSPPSCSRPRPTTWACSSTGSGNPSPTLSCSAPAPPSCRTSRRPRSSSSRRPTGGSTRTRPSARPSA